MSYWLPGTGLGHINPLKSPGSFPNFFEIVVFWLVINPKNKALLLQVQNVNHLHATALYYLLTSWPKQHSHIYCNNVIAVTYLMIPLLSIALYLLTLRRLWALWLSRHQRSLKLQAWRCQYIFLSHLNMKQVAASNIYGISAPIVTANNLFDQYLTITY